MNNTRCKVVSKSGSLTIPADIRREYNAFLGGEAVDIHIQNGKLVIAPHTPRCIFCSDIHEVMMYMDKGVCRGCLKRMVKEAGADES